MKTLLKFVCLFLLGAFPVLAGTCPSGANYTNPANPTGAKVTLTSLGVTTCWYISFSLGADTNTGADETHPWAHAPGMPACSSVCISAMPANFANTWPALYGNGFIFRGGDTWLDPGVTEYFAGQAGAYVYYGVDLGWPSSSWTRPIFNSNHTGDTQFDYQNDYAIIDNIEFTGMYVTNGQTGMYIDVEQTEEGVPRDHNVIENCYFHNMSHISSGGQAGFTDDESRAIFGYADATVQILFNVFDNSDGIISGLGQGYAIFQPEGEIAYNYFNNFPNDYVGNAKSFHDNLMDNLLLPYDASMHCNQFENNTAPSPDYIYNNVFRHGSGAGSNVTLWDGNIGSGTDWVFNNVLYDTTLGNVMDPNGGGGTWQAFNNTVESGQDPTPGASPIGNFNAGTATSLAVTFTNNHFITSNSVCTNNCSTVTETTDYKQSAPGSGYTIANSFAPTASNSPTVGVGTNLSSNCTAIGTATAVATKAQAACKLSTSFAVTYNTSNHTVSWPGIATVTRPTSGAWNVGAYQYQSSTPTMVQHVLCPSSVAETAVPSSAQAYKCPLPALTQAGNTLLVAVTAGGNYTFTVTDTQSDSFALLKSAYDTTNTQILSVLCATGITAGSNNIWVQPSSAAHYMQVDEYEFQNASCTPDGTPSGNTGTVGTSMTAGNITTTTSGDLIFQAVVNDGNRAFSSVAVGTSPWALEGVDLFAGFASQYQVQASAGAINPAFTQGTSSRYISVGVSLLASSSGANTSTFRVLSVDHLNNSNVTSATVTAQCPVHGNLLVLDWTSDGANTLNSVTDGTNTISQIGGNSFFPSNGGVSSRFYAKGISASDNETLTLHQSAGIGHGSTVFCYDIVGASANPLDTGFGGASNGLAVGSGYEATGTAGDVTLLTATPSAANEIILVEAGIDYDSANGCPLPTGCLFQPAYYPGEPEPSLFDENNYWAVYYNGASTTAKTWTMSHNAQDYPGVGNWSAAGSAFSATASSQAATPTFAPVAGPVTTGTLITISDTTPSPTITYCFDTNNTCTPGTVGTTYTVTTSGYLRAFATASGYTQSNTASGHYTIQTSWTATLSESLTTSASITDIGPKQGNCNENLTTTAAFGVSHAARACKP